ncbi:hypothetical protein FrEUN1fDRAFT_7265 [Parafrankia sp. EUN1f]|nr:hypothetical protein FrEUN1fDRAFT_7265 [Parafrankia sp. EUN1f]
MWSRPIVSNVVTLDVNATYLTDAGKRVPALVSLGFDPLDPVAITVRAQVDEPRLAMATFARALFVVDDDRRAGPAGPAGLAGRDEPDELAGLAGPDGPSVADGARVEPVVRGGRRLLSVSVPCPGGRAALEVSATRVSAFIQRTYTLVPVAAEAAMIDLDLDLGLAALGCG